MVSKASDDLPEPLKPVITTSLSRGMLSDRFLRLCCRAPPILMNSLPMLANRGSKLSGHVTTSAAPWKELVKPGTQPGRIRTLQSSNLQRRTSNVECLQRSVNKSPLTPVDLPADETNSALR